MATGAQENEEEISEDDLIQEAETEVSEDDLLNEARAAPAPAPTAVPVWVRDRKTGRLARTHKATAEEWAARGEAEIVPDDRARVEYDQQQARASAPPPAMPTPPRAPAKDPGFFTTVGRNLMSGFFKQGADEAAGALAGAFTDVGPGARYKMPDGTTRPVEDGGDVYRAVRDTEREVLRGGNENYPWTSFAANLAGDVASDAALSAFGVPVGSTPYQVASGAVSGLLGSDAELSTDSIRAGDVGSAAASTGLGAGLGYVTPKAGAAVSRHLTPALASRMRKWLEDSAIKQGRRVLLNGADSLAGNKELPADAVREALSSGAIAPFGTTQKAYENLESLAEVRGANYGDILKRLQAAGVGGPNVEGLAGFFEREAADRWANSGANKSVSQVFANEADNIRAVAPPAPNGFNLVGEGPMAVTGPRLGPEPRTAPRAAPAVAPLEATPTGPVTSPLLTPPPTQKVPTLPPLGGEATAAGRPRNRGAQSPAASSSPSPIPEEAVPFAPPSVPLAEAISGPRVENLPLDQAERIKRFLQGEARWDRLRLTGLDEAKQEVSSAYRGAIEDAIAEAGDNAPIGSEVAELASEFLPVKQQLARTIAARDAAERGTAAAAKRRGISLTDYLSAGAAASGGPAAQLLAAAGNNFLRNRGTSGYAVGAFNAAQNVGRLVNPQTAEAFGNAAGASLGRQVRLDSNGRPPPPDNDAYRRFVMSNPQAFGVHAQRLTQAAEQGPEAFAVQDYMLAQSDPAYAEARRRALMEANGEAP